MIHNFRALYSVYNVLKILDPKMAKQEEDRMKEMAEDSRGNSPESHMAQLFLFA